jgi:hypothetical protein
VACADCPVYSVHFPLSAPARYALVESGVQTAAGFTVDDDRHSDDVKGAKVSKVDSAASNAGLKPGDVIEEADGLSVASPFDLTSYVGNFNKWPRGKTDLTLKVKDTKDEEKTLTLHPVTIGLHPTQLYETISMVLVMLLLMAYEPFKTRDGQVMVLMMLTYAVHRFVNEMLRNDPRPIGFERYASLFLFGAGLVMALWLRLRPAQYRPSWSVPAPA